jgi:putative peptide zinc metalloprotease protein
LPVYKSLRYMITSPQIRRRRMRVWGVMAPALVLLLLGTFVVPLPSRSQAEGVIWPPEQAIVHAGANGFFEAFVAQPGKPVAKGDLLIRSGDPALDAEIRLGEARVAELEARYAVEFSSDRAKAEIVREQLLGERAALLRTRERADALLVRSGADGIFSVQQAEDMPGRYHKKGDVLGYVMVGGPAHARVVVNQAEVDGVAGSGDEVALRMVHAPDRELTGQVVRQVPAGNEHLPSRVLSLQGGGRVAVDPRDPAGLRTLERMFQLDVELESDASPILYGQRVYVRFAHPPQPLATQFYRAMRRLFLTHFDV